MALGRFRIDRKIDARPGQGIKIQIEGIGSISGEIAKIDSIDEGSRISITIRASTINPIEQIIGSAKQIQIDINSRIIKGIAHFEPIQDAASATPAAAPKRPVTFIGR
jgi:hypothetical protein